MSRLLVAPFGDPAYVYEQLKRDARSSIRWRSLCLAWFLLGFVPQFKSIFLSMNIELPRATSLVLAASDLLQDWWFLILPVLLANHLWIETRIFPHLSYSGLKLVGRLVLVALATMFVTLHLPMLRLINSVG